LTLEQKNYPYPWRVLLSGLALQFAFGFIYAWGAVVPEVRLQDHWSPLLTSAVFSAGPLGYGTGMMISGRLAERYPPRRLCWTGVGLLVSGFAIAFLIPNGVTFALFYSTIALGLGGAITLAGALAAGISVFPRRVGAIGGALTSSYALAAVIEAPLVSSLAITIGWLNALRFVGSGVALLAVGAVVLMPSISPSRPAHISGHTVPFVHLLRRGRIWVGFLLEATASPLGSYAFAAVAVYARLLHLAFWIGTLAVTAVAIGNAIGRLGGGVAADRFGVNRVFLVLFATALLAAVLLYRPVNGLAILLAALAAGVSFGAPAGILSRLATVTAPDAPYTVFGVLFAGFAAGALYGPLLGAAVGTPPSWLVLGGVAAVGCAVLVAHMTIERKKSAAP
jgi:MFS family permease